MKKLAILLVTLLCCVNLALAEAPASLEERMTALEARIAALEELLRQALTAPGSGAAGEDDAPAFIPVVNPKYVEGAVWYQDAEQGVTLECTDFYYNATNRGQIVLSFTVKNRSEHTVQFSAQNVYIDGWLHSTAISTASMDKLAPGSNMKDAVQLTDLIGGKIEGIDELSDIAHVQEIRFELVLRMDNRETERIPVRITDMRTMEEKPW